MPDRQPALTDERLKTPRAAALAGILFVLLFSSAIVLIRLSVAGGLLATYALEAGRGRLAGGAS
jgi:hypothetical protein